AVVPVLGSPVAVAVAVSGWGSRAVLVHCRLGGHSPTAPAAARRPATTSGSVARNAVTSSAVNPRCSDTRTLACDSTPSASSACECRTVSAVHEAPEDTAKPRRSSSVSSASPSTYRQENVTRCGSRSSGSPTTSTSGTSRGTSARIRSTSGRSRAASASASASTACSEAAAATTAGTFSNPGTRPDSRSSAGPGCTQRMPLRTTSRPTPGGRPHLCALADASDQPGGSGTRPTDWAASTYSGTPRWAAAPAVPVRAVPAPAVPVPRPGTARAQTLATSATGCTVPTSWLADCS